MANTKEDNNFVFDKDKNLLDIKNVLMKWIILNSIREKNQENCGKEMENSLSDLANT